MSILPKSIIRVIDEFAKLPGIGPKTASRLVFYLLTQPATDVENFSAALGELRRSLVTCKKCYSISEHEMCDICEYQRRDATTIMIVEEPLDTVALEKTGYTGLYHVLGGVISPIDGIGPDNLRIKELIDRLKDPTSVIAECILATDPSLEGEATALYISTLINQASIKGDIPSSVNITRIARGLPVGGDLEYADEVTLRRALEGRAKAA